MKRAITTGNFDGVHLGHQELLKKFVNKAMELNLIPTVVTFDPHPQTFFCEENPAQLLCSIQERKRRLEEFGVEVILLSFNQEIADLTADEFIQNILIERWNMELLWLGHDHRFGKNREHLDVDSIIRKFKIKVEKDVPFVLNQVLISSTQVRSFLTSGNLNVVQHLLGRSFSLTEKVVFGDQIGRQIGFPTANLKIRQDQIYPQNGVYVVQVKWRDQMYQGVCNLGFRPTLQGKAFRVEIHLFEFSESLYDEELEVTFLTRIRSEQRFADLDALKHQIQLDCHFAARFFEVRADD